MLFPSLLLGQPSTIGLALHDNPVGQLAWIAQQIIDCMSILYLDVVAEMSNTTPGSDPRAGSEASVLTSKEILRFTSLYFLTDSFLSSVFIYFSNPTGFRPNYTKAPTDAPMLYSNFKYNNAFFPRALVERVGNLVFWKGKEIFHFSFSGSSDTDARSLTDHDFGGHFPGVDNPLALVSDLREIADHWES